MKIEDGKSKYEIRKTQEEAVVELVANFDLVGDDRASFVANGFDFADGETAIVKIGTGFLKRVVKIVLQCRSALRRSKHAGVNFVKFRFPEFGDAFDLGGIGGETDLRLVAEPSRGAEEDEGEDNADGDVVLPGGALVGPEESAIEDLAWTGHVSPPECRRR